MNSNADFLINPQILNWINQIQAIAPLILTVLFILLITFSILIVFMLTQIILKKRAFAGFSLRGVIQTVFSIILIAGIIYCVRRFPEVFLNGLSWKILATHYPSIFSTGHGLLMSLIVVICGYSIINFYFPKWDFNSIILILLLSVISGLGNSIIIMLVNFTLHNASLNNLRLLVYFLTGIALWFYGQKLVRLKLVNLTNKLIFKLRSDIVHDILHSSYHKIETIEKSEIQAILNNDIEYFSSAGSMAVTLLTSSITLICCFIYLSMINGDLFLFSLAFIIVSTAIYGFLNLSASRHWTIVRKHFNTFIRFLNELSYGLMELSIHSKKKAEFKEDFLGNYSVYMESRVKGELKFANASLTGELMIVIVMGGLLFVSPLLSGNLQKIDLNKFIFVLLYMTIPIYTVLNCVPNIIQLRISWNRIRNLKRNIASSVQNPENSEAVRNDRDLEIALIGLQYQYKNKDIDTFGIGPVSCKFSTGKIIFITGGNGSGKTTLAKLLTGIYPPDKGRITVNGKTISHGSIGEYYSVIFNDHYLFKKLYGIDCNGKAEDIEYYLKEMRVDGKVNIQKDEFNTIDLSSGQRKRLALLVSYLEEKRFCLFDEWAADQDPDFKRKFYCEILPELKKQNKCIIVISHDDRYFHIADEIIRMENGRIVSEN